MVSRDVGPAAGTTAGNRRTVELAKRKVADNIKYASNPFPKIPFAAGAWVDNRSSSRRCKYTIFVDRIGMVSFRILV